MRLKIIALASFMMLCGNILFAQIRDYVFIVRPVYDEKMLAFIDETAKTLNEKGYKDLSSEVDAQKKGWFGSGFLYIQGNRKFVITNRHVVGDSSTINLELEAADGTKQLFEGNKVIAVDDEVDLAIIEITAKNSFTKGLKLSDTRPEDGADVWTAGYPGLINTTPSWQLGKGIITNSHARFKELVDPEKSDIIQHSAQIDGGNSGGPLLIADKTAVTGYAVIGVNTWKVRSRQAANYSLPVNPALKNFIEKNLTAKTSDKEAENLKTRINEFAKISAIKNDEDPNERLHSISRFISTSCVMQSGENALVSVLSSAPSRVRNDVLWVLQYTSVFDAMRIAIAYDIDKKLNDGKNPVAVSAPDLQKNTVNAEKTEIIFSTDKNEKITTTWKEENNMWRLDTMQDVTIVKSSDEKTKTSDRKAASKFDIYNPFDSIFFLEYDLSFSNHDAAGFGLISFPSKYFGIGFGLTISYLSVDRVTDDFDYNPGDIENVKTWSGRPVAIARIQVPFDGPSFSIIPYIEGRAGAQIIFETNLIDPPAGIYGSATAGLQFGLTHFVFNISGGVEGVVKTFGDYSVNPGDTLSGLMIFSVGMGY